MSLFTLNQIASGYDEKTFTEMAISDLLRFHLRPQ